MKKLKTIIVDDEAEAREGLRLLLSQDSAVDLVAVCKNGWEALEQIQVQHPDLVFLDIQMPELTGFDVLGRLDKSRLPMIIFVTAFDQYALKAFEIHALDYLLKPFTDMRFFEALNHAKEQSQSTHWNTLQNKLETLLQDYALQQKGGELLSESVENSGEVSIFQERLVVKSSGKIYLVPLTEVLWLEAYDYYVKIHLSEKYYLVRESLKNLEQKLPATIFLRLHKSSMVNINYITELEPYYNGEYIVKLSNGTKLKMSRTYRKNFAGLL
jgi:two-component system LytT family response regulator